MIARIHDDRPCALGEGPLWHPGRGQFFWFDILANRLLSRENGTARHWQFDENVSAAGWTDRDSLLIASETRLFTFNLETGARDTVCPLEADNPDTRSNDGRADPQGGFWIGTMSKRGRQGGGAIYRYYRGETRCLFPGLTIPNAICFSADGTCAYFADTPTRQIMRQRLDDQGWPMGDPAVFADLGAERLFPDGAVIAADGTLWNAQWGAGRVAAYGPDGRFLQSIAVPGRHSSCPAFGGAELCTLLCTSARQDLAPETIAEHPENGMTFAVQTDTRGLAEPRVIL